MPKTQNRRNSQIVNQQETAERKKRVAKNKAASAVSPRCLNVENRAYFGACLTFAHRKGRNVSETNQHCCKQTTKSRRAGARKQYFFYSYFSLFFFFPSVRRGTRITNNSYFLYFSAHFNSDATAETPGSSLFSFSFL